MPRFNPETGAIAILRQDWFDATRTVYQDCSLGYCRVVLSDGTVIDPHANTPVVAGGGGTTAYENSLDLAVHDNAGRVWTGAATTLGCSPDGAYALKLARNSYGPWDVIEKDGSRWRLTDGDAHDIQLLGEGLAIWMIGNAHVANFPEITFPTELTWGGRAAWIPEEGRYLLAYQRQSDGALVCDGHIVLPPSASYYYLDVEYRGGLVRLTWSPSQADTDPQLRAWTLAEIHAMPVSLPPDPVPPEPIPPEPKPPDPTVPPKPEPPKPKPPPGPFPAAHGVVMPAPLRVALRLGQYFASVDRTVHPFPGWFGLKFTDTTPVEAFVISQPRAGDPKLLIRPESVLGAALSADATEYSGNLASEFGVKPNVSESDWGGYEAWNGWTLDQGIRIVLVEYDRDGARYTSACLTVVAL